MLSMSFVRWHLLVPIVPALLRRIKQSLGRNDCKLISVKCFHKAFSGGIAAISPIAGWSGFGGELSDAEVESLVSSVVKGFRDRLDDGMGEQDGIVRRSAFTAFPAKTE